MYQVREGTIRPGKKEAVTFIRQKTGLSEAKINAVLYATSLFVISQARRVTPEQPRVLINLFRWFPIECTYKEGGIMGKGFNPTAELHPRVDIHFRMRQQTKQNLCRLDVDVDYGTIGQLVKRKLEDEDYIKDDNDEYEDD